MPLDQFIAETMSAFATDADEILVEGATTFRGNPGPNEHALATASINRLWPCSGRSPDICAERHRRDFVP
jgi:hypothetical protein